MNARFGRKKKNPPYFSHEFVITNHGDIVSVFTMIIVFGLLYKGTHHLSSSFIFVHYNNTEESFDNENTLYSVGKKDFCLVFFYTLVAIVCHAVIQEYVLDKLTRKLSMTKDRLAKFNDSAHLALFYSLSTFWAVYNIITENYITSLSSLWEDYPQIWFPFWIKLFFIAQICYWLHDYPELYFQRVRKDLIPSRILYASMYLLSVTFAYIGGLPKLCMLLLVIHYSTDVILHIACALHLANCSKFARIGFTIWNVIFIPVRMACIILVFLTLHYGLGKQTVLMVNVAEGNYNTTTIRFAAMVFLFIAQGLMVWNFITFHQKHQRDKGQLQPSKGWFFGAFGTTQKKKEKKKGAWKYQAQGTHHMRTNSQEHHHHRNLRPSKRENGETGDIAEVDHKDVRKRKASSKSRM